jgi:hypothetical protein
MNKGRKMAAERLGDVFAAAYPQQLCGLLRVECLRNGQPEKGELYLLAGQPMYARVGKMQGQDALSYFLTWRAIHFSFDPDAPRPPANLPRTRAAPASSTSATLPAVSRYPPTPIGKTQGSAIERLIPRKIRLEQYVLSLPLTHRQRLLYFLIDGQRTIADLSRCSGKSVEEIETIIYELQHQGLVTIPLTNQ